MKKYILIIFIFVSIGSISSTTSRTINDFFSLIGYEDNDFECEAKNYDDFLKLSFINEKTRHDDVFKWNKRDAFPDAEYSWKIVFEFKDKYFDVNLRTSYYYSFSSDFTFDDFKKENIDALYEKYVFDELKTGSFEDLLEDSKSFYSIYNENGTVDEQELQSNSFISSIENNNLVFLLKNKKLNYLIASNTSIYARFFVKEAEKKLRICFTKINKESSNINLNEINMDEVWKDVSGYYEKILEIENQRKNDKLWEEMQELSRSDSGSKK